LVQPPETITQTQDGVGTVLSILSTKIVLEEYDYEQDQIVNVTYVINDQTQFENVNSSKEIQLKTDVDITFIVVNGKRISKTISVEGNATDDHDASLRGNKSSRD